VQSLSGLPGLGRVCRFTGLQACFYAVPCARHNPQHISNRARARHPPKSGQSHRFYRRKGNSVQDPAVKKQPAACVKDRSVVVNRPASSTRDRGQQSARWFIVHRWSSSCSRSRLHRLYENSTQPKQRDRRAAGFSNHVEGQTGRVRWSPVSRWNSTVEASLSDFRGKNVLLYSKGMICVNRGPDQRPRTKRTSFAGQHGIDAVRYDHTNRPPLGRRGRR